MSICSVSSRLLLHDTNTWDLNNSYGSCDGLLRGVCWSDDGTYILQVNSEGMVEILMATDHDLQSIQNIPVKDSWSATFQREGYRDVAIGTKNGNIIIWDTKNKCITNTFSTSFQQRSVNFVSYNSKNTNLAVTLQNGDTIIYGLMAYIPIQRVILPYSKSISAMKFHHDARSILGLATDEGHVTLQNILANKEEILFKNSHHGPVSDIAYSLTNCDVVLSCGYDKITNVYDIRSKRIVSTINTQHSLTSLDINHENQLALGTKDGLILLYDIRNLTTELKSLRAHEQEVTGVAFQPRRKTTLAVDYIPQIDTETLSSPKSSSVCSRSSDLFRISGNLPSIVLHPPPEDNAKASFIDLMDLDQSFDNSNEENSLFESERMRELNHSATFSPLDEGKKYFDQSTPMTSKQNATLTNSNATMPSPLVFDRMPDSGRLFNVDVPFVDSSLNGDPTVSAKSVEELKHDIADMAYSTTQNYLSIMMCLTKQKLYLEKTLITMTQKINEMKQQQLTIMEENRILLLEIEQLKSNHNLF